MNVIHGQLRLRQAGGRETPHGLPVVGRGGTAVPSARRVPLLPCAHKMLFPAEGFATPPLTVKAARVGEQGRAFHHSRNILHITPLLLQEPFIPREASGFLRWAAAPTQVILHLRPVYQG